MNRVKLKIILEENKIPRDLYSLSGGLPNESYCINEVDGIWEVYYSERGVKSQLKLFNIEEDACEFLYNKLLDIIGR